jgi:hypothetical protein
VSHVETVDPSHFPDTASSSRNASKLVNDAINEASGSFQGDRQQAKAAVNAGFDPRVAVKSLSPNLTFHDSGSSGGSQSGASPPTSASRTLPEQSTPSQPPRSSQPTTGTSSGSQGSQSMLAGIDPMIAGVGGLILVALAYVMTQ